MAGRNSAEPDGRRRGRGRYIPRRKHCSFCMDSVEKIDYKEPAKLRRYISGKD